jgi:hypothetical protein
MMVLSSRTNYRLQKASGGDIIVYCNVELVTGEYRFYAIDHCQ